MSEKVGLRLCNDKSNIKDVSLITHYVRNEVLADQKSEAVPDLENRDFC